MTDKKRICCIVSFAIIATFWITACGICVQEQQMTYALQDIADIDFSKPLSDGFKAEFDIPQWSSKVTAKPSISSAGFVLMDVDTGQVIHQYKAFDRRPNASTTKIMTSILVLENCSLTDTVTASKACSETLYTSIHLKPGEKISVKDLLAGILIRSANDAAVAAAEHIAGTVPKFAEMMNQKALEIGCTDTNFVTPNGLHDDNHYSSPYDLCLMARYAFRFPVFNELIKTKKYTLNSRTMNREDLVLFSNSKFLKNYKWADGVKSGYVKQAGQCYVGSATKSDWRLVSAVLKSGNVSEDTAALMDYGFSAFRHYTFAKVGESVGEVNVGGGNARRVALIADSPIAVTVPKKGGKFELIYTLPQVVAPIKAGQSLGMVVSLLDGETVDNINLRAAEDVEVSLLRKALPFLVGCGVLGGGTLLVRYGTTNSKNISRRRARVAAILRNSNYRR